MKNKKRITAQERDLLALFKAEGLSNKECGRRLNRDPSVIGRELKRNSFKASNGTKYYVAIHAQAKAGEREWKLAHAKQELKNPFVYAYVTEHLRMGWSPDSIAGKLKFDHPDDKYFWITAETIYRWVYSPKQIKKGWFEYLRRKQKRRKKQQGRKVHRSAIPDRVSIKLRPEPVNLRLEFGHWEGDSIEGRGHQGGAHTEVERISRKIVCKKVTSLKSEQTIMAQEEIFINIPGIARKSTTLDNGRENHLHFRLKDKLKMATYFADPYSAWQRGTNEHGNWLLRYYFPKGTDFNTVTEEELEEAAEEINNRPRKILGYQTPNEIFNNLLKKEGGVAFNY